MHNAGLFDEFKDVRIEIDPREDRLITVENVRQALIYAQSGDADAAIIAAALVSPGDGRSVPVKRGLHAPIEQGACLGIPGITAHRAVHGGGFR